MVGSWVVVQSAAEVDLALALDPPEDGGSYSYIATSPGAQFALESRGLACRTNLEFSSAEETDVIARENYGRMRQAVDRLEDYIHGLVPDLPQGFRPFEGVEHGYKNLADSLSFTQLELAAFVREEAPSRLLYWGEGDGDSAHRPGARPEDVGAEWSLFPPGESVVSAILDCHGWWGRLGVVPVRLPRGINGNHAGPTNRWRARLRRMLNPNRIEAFRLIRGGVGGPVLGRGRPRLLVVGTADNVLPFVKYAQRQHGASVDWWTKASHNPVRLPALVPIPIGGSARRVASAAAALSDLAMRADPGSNWSWDSDGALPVGEILWRRLVDYWRWRVPELLSLYARASRYFEAHRPIGALCGTSDPDRIQTILQAAMSASVPLASFQHGGAYGYMLCEWIRLSDLRAQTYAGYGPEGCDYLNDLARSHEMAPSAVSVGWARGSAIERRARSVNGVAPAAEAIWRGAGPRAVYVPTALMGDLRYGPHRDVRDGEYYQQQVQLIQALAEVPDLQIVVKPHYQDKIDNPLDWWGERQGNPRVRLVRNPRFDALLPAVDVVVIDCPTTVLIEAMAAGKPIVYVDFGVFKLTDESAELLRRQVEWVDGASLDGEQLRSAVARALATAAPAPSDNVFLSAYASLDFRPDLLWHALESSAGK